MSVRLFYIDESYNNKKFCLSAIGIRHTEWKNCFAKIKQHRLLLNEDHGLLIRKEIHSQEFLAGKGHVSDRVIGKYQRSTIFAGLLNLVASLPEVMVMNVCLDVCDHKDPQLEAWDRMLNRIERTMLAMEESELPKRRDLISKLEGKISADDLQLIKDRLMRYAARAVIVADEGKEHEITKAFRKMNVHNPIPSKIGGWTGGQRTKSIPVERVLEDPVFRRSEQSYLIQLADCVAFALLKRETAPTPRVLKYKINEMFDCYLTPVCFKKACATDPLGIVRK